MLTPLLLSLASSARRERTQLSSTLLASRAPTHCALCDVYRPLRSRKGSLCEMCVQACLSWRLSSPPASEEGAWVLSLARYHGPLHQHITRAKSGDLSALSALTQLPLCDQLTPTMSHPQRAALIEEMRELGGLSLVPVPSRGKRLAQRGASLPHLLALELSRFMNAHLPPSLRGSQKPLWGALSTPPLVSLELNALKRVNATRPQSSLSRAERLYRQQGSLKGRPALLGRYVCLIDDVCTTGA